MGHCKKFCIVLQLRSVHLTIDIRIIPVDGRKLQKNIKTGIMKKKAISSTKWITFSLKWVKSKGTKKEIIPLDESNVKKKNSKGTKGKYNQYKNKKGKRRMKKESEMWNLAKWQNEKRKAEE